MWNVTGLVSTLPYLRASRLSRPLLALRADRVTAVGRGVPIPKGRHRDLTDRAALAFTVGYNSALGRRGWGVDEPEAGIPARDAGFHLEGAAMASTLLDLLHGPRGAGLPRTEALLRSAGRAHPHTFHCGIGWGFAVLGARPARLEGVDPLLRWLAHDGYGFCAAFLTDRPLDHVAPPRAWSQEEAALFYQGVGRALWFLGTPESVESRVAVFAPRHRRDLWSGVGLASCYAGGHDDPAGLLGHATGFEADLAVGAVSAAVARVRGEVFGDEAELALGKLTGLTGADAVALHDECLSGLDPVVERFAYQRWRRRVRARLAEAH